MSFANEFKRAQQKIAEEVAYYRTFAKLEGMFEPIAALEEMQEKWRQHVARFENRGRTPSAPADWLKDAQIRSDAKECMNKIIKAAAIAAAATVARSDSNRIEPEQVGPAEVAE